MIIRREINIVVVEDPELQSIGVEVSVDEGMTLMEAVGLMEVAKIQHLQSRHEQGPTIYQAPDET